MLCVVARPHWRFTTTSLHDVPPKSTRGSGNPGPTARENENERYVAGAGEVEPLARSAEPRLRRIARLAQRDGACRLMRRDPDRSERRRPAIHVRRHGFGE